jgi:hypothetical protein
MVDSGSGIDTTDGSAAGGKNELTCWGRRVGGRRREGLLGVSFLDLLALGYRYLLLLTYGEINCKSMKIKMERTEIYTMQLTQVLLRRPSSRWAKLHRGSFRTQLEQ